MANPIIEIPIKVYNRIIEFIKVFMVVVIRKNDTFFG